MSSTTPVNRPFSSHNKHVVVTSNAFIGVTPP